MGKKEIAQTIHKKIRGHNILCTGENYQVRVGYWPGNWYLRLKADYFWKTVNCKTCLLFKNTEMKIVNTVIYPS